MGDTEGPTPAAPAARGSAAGWARSNRRALAAAAVAIFAFAVVGVFVWSFESTSGEGDTAQLEELASESGSGSVGQPPVDATIVSVDELREATTASGQPVYWAGTREGAELEYTRTSDGTTYVRYLTGDAKAGAPGADYVVVATYPQPGAYERVSSIADRRHFFTADLANDGLAVIKPDRPQNIYVVYPDSPYQIEVYAPTANAARQLVFAGAIRPVAS